ncbi:MAG: L-serine ammonia-lyase [Chlamydiota bacterium]|nr:L-serine ammonia-lyase [Chlamydiota bacterium]
MSISVFDLFSIGIGPSSSHTVGPMRAAAIFSSQICSTGLLTDTHTVKVDLYGSLALTGKGHATDVAIILGLEGDTPEKVDPNEVTNRIDRVRTEKKINFFKKKELPFDESKHLLFHMDKQLPYHPNGMRFTAYDVKGREIAEEVYYSVGGGFIVDHKQASHDEHIIENSHPLPYPFENAAELLKQCRDNNMNIQEIMMENEKTWRSEQEVRNDLLNIWKVMELCIDRGCREEGILPGGLNVRRRAKAILNQLIEKEEKGLREHVDLMEWVSLWALAVNEENAAGGSVVTAPTNGSAGVIPAVIQYYLKMTKTPTDNGIITFLLVAGAIGILYKKGASISAAEMGCMGEVGVACSMAAAGLTAAKGGSVAQVENAAEIGMEHNLGLTCDPIKGLVQIPCIERNTMGAIKAINAALLAMRGDGQHLVSLDHVIATMRETGHNMKSIYKETSQGGLAVNVPEC